MATAAAPSLPQGRPDRPDRPGRRRPFSTWVKKLTNFKASSSTDPASATTPQSKRPITKKKKQDKRVNKNNNPYPESGAIGTGNGHNYHDNNNSYSSPSFSSAHNNGSADSLDQSPTSADGHDRRRHTAGARSLAPTVATDHEGQHSIAAPSHGASSVAGTSRTMGGIESRRGGDSTFSSPAPSVRSLTTTLTTIHSSMPPNGPPAHGSSHHGHGHGHSHGHGHGHSGSAHHGNAQAIQFHQPFPSTAAPASAIPAHLAPSSAGPGHPTTYTSATANNLLTDNASILTLASSSKRRRRRSLDTDASVRALAPSSLWGGSRESLPLSVLSAHVDPAAQGGLYQSSQGGSRGGGGGGGERSSLYAKQPQNDGGSMRSGLLGHGRAESTSGSVIGGLPSPLATWQRNDDGAGAEESRGSTKDDDDGAAVTATAEGKERERDRDGDEKEDRRQ